MEPDVLAWRLPAAAELCRQLGWEVEVVRTAPPGRKPGGPERVLRFQAVAPRKAVLTVACEEENLKEG
ncbi:hypothetical protein [Desulfovirgula thermocuniculi]|uniref:hypothetical protein n=1 Tax=Desulfovirgula thermocuniculi TaxID=348842 RepID=UPI00040EC990|nr:hypothetical protein [Desulfovirgula thermocuniculi]